MSGNDFIDDIFGPIDEARKPKPKPVPPKKEIPQPMKKKKLGIFDIIKNGWRAAKDVMSGPPESEKVVVDYKGSQIIGGSDVTFVVPENVKTVEVQLLEPNGRLKNNYILTNYLAIKPGDKFRLISK